MTTKSAKSGWPDAGAFPFLPFGLPGTGPANAPASSAAADFLQGMTGGVDLMKDFWSRLPGGAQVPGFMVPTLDVDELDRRITDLKAAESWVAVNLNLLRTTIQGLEVQRNTIAAIQSLSAMADAPKAAPAWPPAGPAPTPPWAAPTAESPAPAPAPAEPADSAGATESAALPPAAAHWLSLLQDQFARVAQAALTPAATTTPAAKATARRPVAKRRRTPSAKS